ncbi:MAG: hypothetical protein KDD59_02830 [Bdellovibrionales bacterium]|nr:hypothetical protein [Bdellovibrionales bacterium]
MKLTAPQAAAFKKDTTFLYIEFMGLILQIGIRRGARWILMKQFLFATPSSNVL